MFIEASWYRNRAWRCRLSLLSIGLLGKKLKLLIIKVDESPEIFLDDFYCIENGSSLPQARYILQIPTESPSNSLIILWLNLHSTLQSSSCKFVPYSSRSQYIQVQDFVSWSQNWYKYLRSHGIVVGMETKYFWKSNPILFTNPSSSWGNVCQLSSSRWCRGTECTPGTRQPGVPFFFRLTISNSQGRGHTLGDVGQDLATRASFCS